MAKRTGVDLLFHPKKKPHQASPKKPSQDSSATPTSTPGTPSTPSPSQAQPAAPKRQPRPRPKVEADDDATKPAPPEGPFSEYKLMSSALNGWKYDVLKFDSRKPVDITTWEKPVKLNRKDSRRNRDDSTNGPAQPQPVAPMLGPDGKPVVGMDGRVVMVDAEGKPIRSNANGAADGGKGKEKEKPSAPKKKFQKKTKRVFLVPDAVRQLRREERYPWVMEDGSGKETWMGSMEEVAKAETQAMFMPAAGDIFKFVPAHRWYKFQKKPNYHIPNLEEAESLMSQIQKNKDPERWLLRRRNGQGPSEATAAMFKSEREGSAAPAVGSLVHSAGQSYGPGGRRLKTVDSGSGGLFGDDDDDDDGDCEQRRRRIKREYGQEGDLDELDFEETFQDDEEKPDNEAEDEEEKELEERLKREYKTANKTREGYIDESDDEEETNPLSGAGKAMRKLMKKLEKNTAYDDSDEEKNPYASSEEEEPEEEIPQVPQGPAIIPPEPRPSSRSTSQAPATQPATPGTKTPSGTPAPAIKTESGSRATSPVPLGHGGHSVVAKRATSPKVPKLKPNGASRAGSPLAGGSPTSPVGSPPNGRAESPPSQAGSPTLSSGKPMMKRKAEDGAGSGTVKKKRKSEAGLINGAANGAGPLNGVDLDEGMLIAWLRQTPHATTQDCIAHFRPFLTTAEKKQHFTTMVKTLAQLKNGILVLRNAYRDRESAGPTSPAAASPEPSA